MGGVRLLTYGAFGDFATVQFVPAAFHAEERVRLALAESDTFMLGIAFGRFTVALEFE